METRAATQRTNVTAPDGGELARKGIQAIGNQTQCPTDLELQPASKVIVAYLMETVEEFRNLTELRREGWSNQDGDQYFQKQRHNADNSNKKTALHFYNMMKEIGEEMHISTDAFRISRDIWGKPAILDMCMAPGGFLAKALSLNSGSHALGFSLPSSNGGHKLLLPKDPNVRVKFLDITMLAADMGMTDIPAEHPDAENFLPPQFKPGQRFDLILCDGQVLRTHSRASYRETREATRLTVTQLALGLEHVRQGGTMIVLLHKLESWRNVSLLYTFNKFSSIKLFKPKKSHAKRSSFYMVATGIQNEHPEAIRAVKEWKAAWRVATFGTDEEYRKTFDEGDLKVRTVLEEFGLELVRLGKDIWSIQAEALAVWQRLLSSKQNES